MAGSKLVDIHGKIKYIHAVNLNKYNKWSVTLYPDDKSLEIIRDLQSQGLKNVMKKDDDNQYYITFHREPTKSMRGKVVAFQAPKVVDNDGKPFDGMTIGWGSDAIIRLEVYKSTPASPYKYVAARWDAVKVTNLVPFELDKSDWSDEDKENIKDLAKVPDPEEQPW